MGNPTDDRYGQTFTIRLSRLNSDEADILDELLTKDGKERARLIKAALRGHLSGAQTSPQFLPSAPVDGEALRAAFDAGGLVQGIKTETDARFEKLMDIIEQQSREIADLRRTVRELASRPAVQYAAGDAIPAQVGGAAIVQTEWGILQTGVVYDGKNKPIDAAFMKNIAAARKPGLRLEQ